MLQAVFVDRDGTIGGNGHFIHPNSFELFPFSQKAIKLLKEKGLKVFAFTNQHRIARGEAKMEDFNVQFETFGFDGAYICPHDQKDECKCHKPKPGLLLKAAEEHSLDLHNCAVIGDVGSTDMLAAQTVGAIKILVRTGWGMESLNAYRHTWYDKAKPDHVADNFGDACNWLVNNIDIIYELRTDAPWRIK
ncbi:HAD-IIIA family hydrolase [Gorillibacterium timonense]|uniref:HAD-IIIA family hydrolase n=1 Tax=Gorillibacterium timonense TaxID=1689269 RepID=UPI00071D2714|nr:HAD-IIIA family hydrolase [Gorillibacterium timonense]